MRATAVGSLLLLAASVEPAAAGGELTRVLEEIKPLARFKGHKPRFHIAKKQHTWWWWDWQNPDRSKRWIPKQHKAELEILMDGEMPIGLAPDWLWSPFPGADTRNRLDETYTPGFKRFGMGIPSAAFGAFPISHKVARTGETMDIVIKQGVWPEEGIAEGHGPSHPHRKATPHIGCVTRLTFRVDPVLGYVVDRETRWRHKGRPKDKKTGKPAETTGSGSFFPFGVTIIWPGAITYAYSGCTPDASDRRVSGERFAVWSNNCESLYRKYHPVIRPDGFAAYLSDRSGWGMALLPQSGVPVRYPQCPIWGEFHTSAPVVPLREKDGYCYGTIRQRMVGLPPEICRHVVKNAKVVNGHGTTVLIRPGGEDFEDQPLPASTTLRGFQPVEGKVSDRRAHSGKKSLEVNGVTAEEFTKTKFWPRDRGHTRFLPAKRYRLECWVFVEGEDAKAFVIPTPGMGYEPRELLGAETAGKGRTRLVRSGDRWQKAEMEFVSAKHGNPINVRFVVIGRGKAYFDDFKLERISRGGA